MTVLDQTNVSITLMWDKVQNISTYIVRYGYNSSMEDRVNRTEGASITHEISRLTPATKYNFTIITVREESESTGYTVKAVTSKQDWITLKISSLSRQSSHLLVIVLNCRAS